MIKVFALICMARFSLCMDVHYHKVTIFMKLDEEGQDPAALTEKWNEP